MAKSSFMQLLRSAVKLIVVLGAFFLFGYLELQYRSGFIVAFLIGAYLFRTGSRVVPSLLVIGNLLASWFALKPVVVLSFLALNISLFLTEHKPPDDTKVVLRPYESEVRSILFRHDPSLLHTVDSMLDEHEGREKELIYKLNAQYETGTPKKTPSKASVSSVKKPEPTPTRFENPPSESTPAASPRGNEGNWRSPAVLSPVVNSSEANTVTVVKQIKNILRVKDPSLFKSVDRMLLEYQGREGELLKEVQDEYMCDHNDSNVSASFDAGYPNRSSGQPQTYSLHTSPSQQRYTSQQQYDTVDNYYEQDSQRNTSGSWERPGPNYRTLDGRPAVVSLERGFASPYSQYSSAPTPLDMHSVESMHGGSGRLPPFSPTGRVVSMKGSPRANLTSSAPTNYTATNDSSRAYREELAQAPYNNNNNNDTPRYHPTSSNNTGNTNSQAYRNSVIQQAQEDARREMQARIEARWGGKGTSHTSSGTSSHSGASSGVQKRHGYSYGN